MTIYQILMTKYLRLLTNDYQISTKEYIRKNQQIMQNKPNVKYAKINLSSYITSIYENMDNWLFRQTKPKQTQLKPIQTQLKPKQTQFKPNQSQFESISDFEFMRNTLEYILGCADLLVCRGIGEETNLKVVIEVFRPAVITIVDGLIFFYLSINPDSLDMLGPFCITVNRRQYCTDFHITRRNFKRKRHLSPERLQDVLDAAPEHRIVRPRHTNIRDIRGPFGKNFLIGGYNVGVSSETQARPAVEMIAHSDFFTRRFGVKVNDYNIRLLLELRQNPVNSIIRAIGPLHIKPPYQSNHGHGRPFCRLIKCNPPSGRMLG